MAAPLHRMDTHDRKKKVNKVDNASKRNIRDNLLMERKTAGSR